jgi:plastocyanin
MAQTITVKIPADEPHRFEPTDPPSIAVGDTVSWVNESEHFHTVTPDNAGDFDGGQLAGKGTAFDVTFDRAGVFPYHCDIHGEMFGTITVTEAGKSAV